MATDTPTNWSYSQNPPISNYGTKVDARLNTITPTNPRGYVRLSTTSTDSIINGSAVQLYYAIDNNGRVTYADIDNQGNIRRQYNNIQEIASSGKIGYSNQTTLRIKDSLQINLKQRTENNILSNLPVQNPPSGDPQGGSTGPVPLQVDPSTGNAPDVPSLPGSEESIISPATKPGDKLFKKTGGRLQYPEKISTEQDKIKFVACEIQREAPSNAVFKFQFPGPTYNSIADPVVLPIQASINDQNSVDWGPDSITAIDAAIYDQSLNLMRGITTPNIRGENSEFVNTFMTALGENFTKYQNQIERSLAGAAAGVNNILARTDNAVLNPNLELLFQGPQLRPFSFQFKMSARTQSEADIIKSIIKYFKYHMAVRKTDDGLFLKAPYVFTIQYLKGEINHTGINLISPNDTTKACALTNCSVDYTPLGTYATYEDGTMVSYTLSLQFQEITPIYDTDYGDHPIGY
jgi:hypothetical protein